MKHSRLRDRKLGVKKVEKKKNKSFLKYFLFLAVFLVLLVASAYLLLPKTWNGNEKIAVVTQQGDEAKVVILDPSSSSITTIEIPPDTEVTASNQLGVWKMKSITKLAKDENLDGSFLKNTLIKSFNFPIDYWAGDNFLNLSSGNLLNNDTNLTFIDKIRIASFALGVRNNQKYNLSLEDSGYLEKALLKDSSLGWVIKEQIPAKIEVFFTQDSNLNLLINNKTAKSSVGEMLSRVVEVLGIKVASIEKGGEENFDCKITGINKVVYKLGRIFECSVSHTKPSDNFDIQIDIGSKFRDRF